MVNPSKSCIRLFLLSFFMLLSIRVAKNTVVVNGDSMYPTFTDGQVLLNRVVPPTKENMEGHPVCIVRLSDGNLVLKRLVGYPNQTVELVDGDTYVDGELLLECEDSWDNIIFQLGSDEYLFLGDNRDHSMDARHWSQPAVSSDAIIGIITDSELNAR